MHVLQIDKCFGFDTAVEEAQTALLAAKVEASSADQGIGLVKLMGRSSGFIAMQASMASGCHPCTDSQDSLCWSTIFYYWLGWLQPHLSALCICSCLCMQVTQLQLGMSPSAGPLNPGCAACTLCLKCMIASHHK